MNDLYLKAADATKLYAALKSAGVVVEGEDGWHVSDAHKYALDVIGVIYKPTGKMLDTDMGEVPETAPLPGYHANLRVMTADFDPASLADLACNPKAPARGWA